MVRYRLTNWTTATAVLLAAMVMGGCEAFVAAPDATVRGVEVVEVTDAGTAADIVIALTNPNDVPLPLVFARYEMQVNGSQVQATTTPNATVPAEGEHVVRLRAAVPTAPTGSYTVRGSFRYVPPGEIRTLMTDFGIPLPTTGFEGSGNLDGTQGPRDEGTK